MVDVPRPQEAAARATVEAYLEECVIDDRVLAEVAVLHHREAYFEALELLVEHRGRLLGPDPSAENPVDGRAAGD